MFLNNTPFSYIVCPEKSCTVAHSHFVLISGTCCVNSVPPTTFFKANSLVLMEFSTGKFQNSNCLCCTSQKRVETLGKNQKGKGMLLTSEQDKDTARNKVMKKAKKQAGNKNGGML